ncbi:MAG: CDP-alcohol phosphatidyltransferase family protein [Nitrospinales bacterium]
MSLPAIILLDPPEGDRRVLFNKRIAGVELFKRLVLTICRAGISEIIVISQGLSQLENSSAKTNLLEDSRFKGNLTWLDDEQLVKDNGLEIIEPLTKDQRILLCKGNIVTTPKQIKCLLDQDEQEEGSGKNDIKILSKGINCDGEIILIPESRQDSIEYFINTQQINEPTEEIQTQGGNNFCLSVIDMPSLRRAENRLLCEYKSHYSQLMDIWFNSYFSIPISSYLLKVPITPNQITLFGLVIGAISGWCFSIGNYWGGLCGGILLVFTAIWDCCDGDVARLKFMESDFGEYLDTLCDNIINIFIFVGIAVGVGKEYGILASVIPFVLLAIGGISIFILIYFPKGLEKGAFFKGTLMYDVILLLASRNFVYIIFFFALFNSLDWFLWIAGFGANIFAIALLILKRKISPKIENNTVHG